MKRGTKGFVCNIRGIRIFLQHHRCSRSGHLPHGHTHRLHPKRAIGIDSVKGHHVTFGNGVEGIVMLQPTKGEAASPAMDDRCACALLCELLMQAENPRNTIVGVFSTQEEVGLRGATTAAYQVAPDLGVGLDVTAWGDTPETKLPAVKLGAGAAVKFLDRSMIATPVVRDALIAAAEKAGAAYQREVLPFGGTDGAAIQHARGGIPAGTLSIPCRYVHSACETIDMRDMDSALCILKEFVNGEY